MWEVEYLCLVEVGGTESRSFHQQQSGGGVGAGPVFWLRKSMKGESCASPWEKERRALKQQQHRERGCMESERGGRQWCALRSVHHTYKRGGHLPEGTEVPLRALPLGVKFLELQLTVSTFVTGLC